MNIIEGKILDRKFTRLVWKSLKAGHFEFAVYSNNIIGRPQGSIISPLLANIYLNQLDVFMHDLKSGFDQGKESRESSESRRYHYLVIKAKECGDISLLKQLAKDKLKIP